ncbi:hypothetical protein HMPREF1437_01287 [Helicobacter pylori HP116Bi]|nr:hypothetical protein HMPREF1437_01287 [Helicobacter pylori HP116Bi]
MYFETIKQKLEKVKDKEMRIRKIEKPFDIILEARMLLKQETQKSVKAYNAMMGHQPQRLKHGLKNFNNPLSKEG